MNDERIATPPLFSFTPEMETIILEKMAKFKGQGTTLESALGALILGQHFGWRVLRIIHSPSTYSKYEKILGIEFKDVVPERTSLSSKVLGIKIADKMNSFWSVVMGRTKVENKGQMDND